MVRGRWEIEKTLGGGGQSETVLALTPDKKRVVVKFLGTAVPMTPSFFEKEIRLLSRIRHPHIVSILGCRARSADILGEDRGPCYWMEFIDGKNILDAARGTNADAVIQWLGQALEALRYLHAQGVLHGDLSPRNLLVDREGNLKMLDFGLASLAGESMAVEAATIPYLAPERIAGRHLPAGDLFSLGTVFYEAIAGKHPRASAAGLHAMLTSRAIPLPEALPSLSRAQAAAGHAVDGMIEIDLGRRFAGADEVLACLNGGESSPKAAEFHSLTFWGAEEALERMRHAVETLREGGTSGSTPLFALHGATGTGKKRFLRELGLQCALSGVAVHEHRDGRFEETANPGREGVHVFRGIERLSLEDLSKLLALRRSGWLKDRLPVLEWSDDFADTDQAAFFSSLVQWPEAEEIFLRPLGPDDARRLIQSALGSDSSGGLEDRLFHQTGGNPGLLVETLSRIRSGLKTADAADVASSWRDALLWKILSLTETERRLLAFLACSGYPVGRDLLEKAAGIENFDGNLHRLLDLECLVSDPEAGSYRPAQPLLEEVLQDVLSPEEIAGIHRRWLAVLREAPPPNLQKLHHAIKLKDAHEVMAGARPAADLLWRQERKKESLRVIERCLDILREGGAGDAGRVETARLLKEKMNLLADLGRYAEALAATEEWFALGPDNDAMPLKTLKYDFARGLYHHSLGHDEEAREPLERCLSEGDAQNPAHRPFLTRAHSLVGLLDLRQGRLAPAKDHLERALALSEPQGRRRAEIHRNLAELFSAEKNWGSTSSELEKARALYDQDGFEQGSFACFLQEGNLALAHKDADVGVALKAYAEAERIALHLDNDALLASVWHNRGVLARRQGRPGEAFRLLPKAAEIFEMLGLKKELAECRENLALAKDDFYREETPMTAAPSHPAPSTAFDWGAITARLSDLNRELLRESDMDIVLRRLMDSAMEIARAQNGFLLIQDAEDADSPIPGFTVAVARNLNRESLKTGEYALSLSAVRQALQTGMTVVTDDALQDPRFRDAKSVQLTGLKSILALPVSGAQGVLGVFYLDHPLKDGLFQGDILKALEQFAGLAGLALQKGRMIEDLKTKNENLATKVDEQSSQMERLAQEVKESRIRLKNEYSEIVGRSPRMVEVLSLVDKVTDAKIPVWIYGESGTGKEAIARALHFNSARKNQPFVTENCSALPENLLESELFGHKKGAFTHATQDKKGLLHYADKGTVFLDEIADMSLSLQAKLLRFLQEGEIRPLGSTQVIKVDVRVVSASNKDLRKLVAEGKFREDLFFRLNGITVKLPPLRERLEDLPLLAEHFLKNRASLAPESLRLFMNYSWPGNVRELQQTLETALLFAEKKTITRKSLEFKDALFGAAMTPQMPALEPIQSTGHKAGMTPDLERILRAIRDQCFHKGKAAEALGMSRRHLYTKLEQYGVSPESASLKAFIEKKLGV